MILKPCSENWDKMSPVDGGRFCVKCSKKVQDLTDGQIVPLGESLCGRIKVPVTKTISFKSFLFRQSPMRYFALMFTLLFVNKVKAQLNKIEVKDLSLTRESEYEFDNVIEVNGKLENENTKMEIADAFVSLFDSKGNRLHIARTDSSGKFAFVILRKSIADSLFTLKAEYIGLETLELTNIPATKKEMQLFITMAEKTTWSSVTTVGALVSTMTGITTSTLYGNNLPDKSLRAVTEIIANTPMTRPQEGGFHGNE
jgi:hypothetical protein